MIVIMSETVAAFILARQDRLHRLSPGQILFRADDRVGRVHVVLEGEIKLVRHGASGAELILQRAVAGAVLAEASCFSEHYHCTAAAVCGSRVASVSRAALFADAAAPAFLFALARDLSREVQRSRVRCEILAMKTVASRLDAWLALNDRSLPEKGGWSLLAAELAVSPEALYRTLAARRGRAAGQVTGSDRGIAGRPSRRGR